MSFLSWLKGPAVAAALTGFAASQASAEPRAFRFRMERILLDEAPKLTQEIRSEARANRESGCKPDKGCDEKTIAGVLSVLAGSCGKDNTFGDFGFTAIAVETIAKRAHVPPSAARRALKWLRKKNRVYTIPRWKRDTRRDQGGHLLWRQRTNLYIVPLRPLVFSGPDDPGLTPEEVLEAAGQLRNEPDTIARVLPVLERVKRDEAAGKSWSEAELREALAQAVAEPSRKAPRATAPSSAQAPSGGGTSAPASESSSSNRRQDTAAGDYEMFAQTFSQVRREPRPSGERYEDDLVGTPSAEAKAEIGAYVRGLTRRALGQPEGTGADEATVFEELSAEITRAYLGKEGRNGFLREQGHPLTYLRGDLRACGELALRRWAKRRRKAASAQPAPTAGPAHVEPRRGPAGTADVTAEFAAMVPRQRQPTPDTDALTEELEEIALARAELAELVTSSAHTGLGADIEPASVRSDLPP